MFGFRHYNNGRFYLVVPEILYGVMLYGSGLAALLSICALIWGVFKKKSKKYFICWSISFLVSVGLIILTLNGIIVAHTMFGGK